MTELDRPCAHHPPPSTLSAIWCRECGAWRLHAEDPVEYVTLEEGARRRGGPPPEPYDPAASAYTCPLCVFTCPRCGLTSHNPKDREEGYCGYCHDWTGPKGNTMKAKQHNETPAQSFILDHPRYIGASELVKMGAAAKTPFSKALVYAVRNLPRFKHRGPNPGVVAAYEAGHKAKKTEKTPPPLEELVLTGITVKEAAPREIGSVLAELDLLVHAGAINKVDAWERASKLRSFSGPAATTVELAEEERLLVLLALATLSRESPDFDSALNRIAMRMETEVAESDKGRARIFESFRSYRAAPSDAGRNGVVSDNRAS